MLLESEVIVPAGEISSEEDVLEWRRKKAKEEHAMAALAELVGELGPDGLEILRRLGDPEYKSLRKFLLNSKKETFNFLADARENEIEELREGIELVRAFRTTGKFLKWALISLAAALTAVITIVNWWKGSK